MTTQERLDYEVMIQTAGKEGIPPEHDCHLVGGHGESGCQVCSDYEESVRWWNEQKQTNKLPL